MMITRSTPRAFTSARSAAWTEATDADANATIAAAHAFICPTSAGCRPRGGCQKPGPGTRRRTRGRSRGLSRAARRRLRGGRLRTALVRGPEHAVRGGHREHPHEGRSVAGHDIARVVHAEVDAREAHGPDHH